MLPAGDSRFLTLGSDPSGSRGGGGGGWRGGALYVISVPPDDSLVRCGNSAPITMGINLFDHSSGHMDCLDLFCDMGESVV